MSRQVTVEQLLIGWSRTSNGKNVLARSPGWPSRPSRSDWVSALGDFLDPATDRTVHETGEVPWLLEFLPSEHGSLLMAKAYAAESMRAGEFQVHALLDPSRTLGPHDLPGLAAAGVLLIERPADVTRLDALTVEIASVPASRDVRVVALALAFLHGTEALLVRAETLDAAAALLGQFAAALPEAVAVRTPARSVVTDATEARGIAIAVQPWTRGAGSVSPLKDATVAGPYLALAEKALAGEWTLPDDAADIGEWLDLALIDPTTVTADELVHGATGRHARLWIERALAAPRTRNLLLDQVRTGRIPWGRWTDDAWMRWLASNRNLSKGLRATVDADDFPARFADVVDRLPRTSLDRVLAQLGRWPAERLGVLADALLRCEDASPELLIQTLDRLGDDEVRRLVQRRWPGIGLQLGLPTSVVQALKPSRSWFGR